MQVYSSNDMKQTHIVNFSIAFWKSSCPLMILGTLTAVESFLTISSGPEGTCGHDATWRSAVHGFADSGALRQLRRKFDHKPLPVVGTKVRPRGFVFFSREIMQYAIPFMGSDPSVVKRTQRFLYQEKSRSPVSIGVNFNPPIWGA
ncbi:saccharopine dehydrogenase-like oxidoreductase, partial [Hippocampus comes]|uniref:saccharopine dehydrogenase-like oxidoreductase n=1 Tax=Hippocampus comes TaxID=109280 RepID=UPI00094E4E02